MRDTLNGTTVLRWKKLSRPYRVRQWLPKREKWLWLMRGGHALLLRWLPYLGGLHLRAEYRTPDLVNATVTYPWRERPLSMKRREALGLTGAPPTPAGATSTLLAKLPAIRAWLSDTSYDDKTVRQPGALRIVSRDALWHLTLTDPDAGARLIVSDASLDKALLLLEQLVGVEDAPWQADPYAVQKKRKK